MAGNARAGSCGEEQEPKLAVEHLEDVWLRISRHLTTKEWLCAAGTCQASWNLEPPNFDLTDNILLKGGARSHWWHPLYT